MHELIWIDAYQTEQKIENSALRHLKMVQLLSFFGSRFSQEVRFSFRFLVLSFELKMFRLKMPQTINLDVKLWA